MTQRQVVRVKVNSSAQHRPGLGRIALIIEPENPKHFKRKSFFRITGDRILKMRNCFRGIVFANEPYCCAVLHDSSVVFGKTEGSSDERNGSDDSDGSQTKICPL